MDSVRLGRTAHRGSRLGKSRPAEIINVENPIYMAVHTAAQRLLLHCVHCGRRRSTLKAKRMAMRTKLLVNFVYILILSGLCIYAYVGINEMTATFIDDRIAHAQFFARIIRENWHGITSFSDDEKKALLESLEPSMLTLDIRTMRFINLFLLVGLVSVCILGCLQLPFNSWRSSREKRVASGIPNQTDRSTAAELKRSVSTAISQEIVDYLETREPGRHVVAALERLFANDSYLLEVDANERSISHKFGAYLQQELPNYSVDCEYNRDGIEPKRIAYLGLHPDEEDTESKTVFPDIVAHIRGQRHNYLVVEFKKSSNKVDRAVDFRKLRGYKSDNRLNYEYALFIELAVGQSPGVAFVAWVDP